MASGPFAREQSMAEQRSARVFISCGQAKDTEETQVANAISQKLKELGFEPYIAINEQTLLGLRENIFERLRNSEYFIFVDFNRERISGNIRRPTYRGSLFSHQELAIASYIDIEVLAFQERGVKVDDGIMRFLQLNAQAFGDRNSLHDVIGSKVQQRGWDPQWRNEIRIERTSSQSSDALQVPAGTMARYFHLEVHNRHRERTAANCYAYLEKVIDLSKGQELPIKSIEFKWAGYTHPSVHIPPRTMRQLDAFFVFLNAPTQLRFNTFADSTEFVPQVTGPGEYEMHYLVTADNFAPARASFKLSLGASLAAISFG
jgi:hypothetical protein